MSTNHLCYCSRQMTMTTSDLQQIVDIGALCGHRGDFHLLLCMLESEKVAPQEQSIMYLSHILVKLRGLFQAARQSVPNCTGHWKYTLELMHIYT